MKKQILIIGVGVMAKDIIDNLYKKEKCFDFLCIDDKKQFLNLSKTKNIWFNDAEFQKTKGDVEYYINVLFKKADTLKKELANYNHAVIVADCGEQFVLDMIFPITKCIRQFDMTQYILAIFNENSDKITKKLLSRGHVLGKNLFLYDSNDIYKKYNQIYENKYLIKEAGNALKMIAELRELV